MKVRAQMLGGAGFAVHWALLAFLWFMGRESRARYAELRTLAATNAPLPTVEASLHARFTIWRRGTSDWEQMLGRSSATNTSRWDHEIATEMRALRRWATPPL